MTDAVSIVVDVRAAIQTLTDADSPAATRLAEALDTWRRGTDFEMALGLAPGWRRHLQQAARDAALKALLAVHPDMDDSAFADRIADGIKAADHSRGIRPDGEDGHYHDLAHAGCFLSARTWRLLIARARGKAAIVSATAALSLWSAPKLEKD